MRRILEHALVLGDARDAGALDAATLVAEARRLEVKVDKLIAGATRYPPNRRLLEHLAQERAYLFAFLRIPGRRDDQLARGPPPAAQLNTKTRPRPRQFDMRAAWQRPDSQAGNPSWSGWRT